MSKAQAAPVSAYLETYRGIVMPEQVDAFGHMGTHHYMVMFTVALGQLYGQCGFPIPQMLAEGSAFVAVEQVIRYERELRALEMVTIESAFLRVGEKSARLRHRMLEGTAGGLCATFEQVSVHFSLAERRSTPIPPAMRGQIVARIIADPL